MSKHTPGPWTYAVFSAHYEEPGLTGWASSVYQDDNCHEDDICKMTHDFDKETVEANARLIAAAPELLEACVAAIEATGGSHFWSGWTRRFLVMAENALRKAGIDPAAIEARNTVGPEDSSEEGVRWE